MIRKTKIYDIEEIKEIYINHEKEFLLVKNNSSNPIFHLIDFQGNILQTFNSKGSGFQIFLNKHFFIAGAIYLLFDKYISSFERIYQFSVTVLYIEGIPNFSIQDIENSNPNIYDCLKLARHFAQGIQSPLQQQLTTFEKSSLSNKFYKLAIQKSEEDIKKWILFEKENGYFFSDHKRGFKF